MFDHKHVYVSLLKRKCLKEKHVSVSCFYSVGIVIDDRLNWKPHIQSAKSKLSSILYIMYKACKLITTAGMYTLYCSLFQPYSIYHTAMKYGVIMLQMSNVCASFEGKL